MIELNTRVSICRFGAVDGGTVTSAAVDGNPDRIEVTSDRGTVRTFTARTGNGALPPIFVQEGYNRSPYLRAEFHNQPEFAGDSDRAEDES